MTDTQHDSLRIGHPAPQRHHVRAGRVIFALTGAPIAWMVELLIGFSTTSYLCYRGQPQVPVASVPGWEHPLLIAVNLIALCVALAAAATSYMLTRRTGEEHQRRSGGVMDAGEGRTRFLAVFALFWSAAIAVAILANTFSLFLVPLCRA